MSGPPLSMPGRAQLSTGVPSEYVQWSQITKLLSSFQHCHEEPFRYREAKSLDTDFLVLTTFLC